MSVCARLARAEDEHGREGPEQATKGGRRSARDVFQYLADCNPRFQSTRYLAEGLDGAWAFVHISSIGLAGGLAPGELLNIDCANVDGCAKVVAANPDVVLGVKVRVTDSAGPRTPSPY